MSPEEKSKLFAIKKSLKDGEMPTKKTIYWLISLIDQQDRSRAVIECDLKIARNEIHELCQKLDVIKQTVISKIGEVFE